MNRLYNEINAKTNNKYKNLRFPKIKFNGSGKTAVVTVLCKPQDRAFVNDNRAEIERLVCDICAFNTPIALETDSEEPTAYSLRSAVVAFTQKFAYVSSALHTVTADVEPEPIVTLKMHQTMRELAQSDYFPRLAEFLSNNFVDEVKVEVLDAAISGRNHANGGKTEYAVSDVQPIIGNLKPEKAKSVYSLTANEYNAVVCGVVAMPTEFISKGGKKYERFLLYDGENSVQCRWSLDGGISVAAPGMIGKTICVLGNVEFESGRGEASIAVREMSYCKADGLEIAKYKPEPTKYERIFPQAYEEYVQSSMFERNVSLPDILKGDFVVFDFETTGLSILTDRPTELGAVKIQNGSITQSFHTLIDPRRDIPPEVVEKTGISNDMVKGQPLFEDILPDFYKFTYGCGMVGHNISFDFPFLIKGGNACGWSFGDRRTYDTMGIAPVAIPSIQKLSLDKVLEGLGLVNDNAHRALSDAAATAKAFVAMHKLVSGKR